MGNVFSWSLVAFLLGIGVHSLWPWTSVSSLIWIAIAFGCAYGFSLFRRDQSLLCYLIVLSALLCGLWRFDITIPGPHDSLFPWTARRVVISGKARSLATSRFGTSMIVQAASVQEREVTGQGRSISVKLPGEAQAPLVGSLVAVSCWLRPFDSRASNEQRRKRLARQDVWTECFGNIEFEVRAPPSRFDVFSRLAAWRTLVTTRIESVLPRDEATLLSGILYGDQDLSDEQRDVMRRAGLMHLVAVSGSNVTIVVNVLLAVLLVCGCRRRQAFWIVTIGILSFIGFVGFSASVVRAGIMGWLVLFARQIGRVPSTPRLLLLTAAVVTCINPWLLAFDPGFALSFLATWGLLSWTPLLKERCRWIPDRFSLRESFATTTGATIMTVPYLAWAFGRMSLAGIFTNLLALPLVPLLMFWGSLAAAWGSWSGSSLISLPAYGLLHLLEKVAHLADVLPWLDLHTPTLDVFVMAAIYLFLFRIWRLWREKTELSTA